MGEQRKPSPWTCGVGNLELHARHARDKPFSSEARSKRIQSKSWRKAISVAMRYSILEWHASVAQAIRRYRGKGDASSSMSMVVYPSPSAMSESHAEWFRSSIYIFPHFPSQSVPFQHAKPRYQTQNPGLAPKKRQCSAYQPQSPAPAPWRRIVSWYYADPGSVLNIALPES